MILRRKPSFMKPIPIAVSENQRILLAKSETGTIYVRCGLENQVDQRKSSSETDFASSRHEESSPPRMTIARAIFTSVSKMTKSQHYLPLRGMKPTVLD